MALPIRSGLETGRRAMSEKAPIRQQFLTEVSLKYPARSSLQSLPILGDRSPHPRISASKGHIRQPIKPVIFSPPGWNPGSNGRYLSVGGSIGANTGISVPISRRGASALSRDFSSWWTRVAGLGHAVPGPRRLAGRGW